MSTRAALAALVVVSSICVGACGSSSATWPAPTPCETRASALDPSPKAVEPARNFSATGSLAHARSHHSATLLQDGRVLIAGGYDSSCYLQSTELYDPSAGVFTPTGSMATGRTSPLATLLRDGRVLIAGGYDGDFVLSAELYDPATGTFSPAGSMAYAQDTATLLADGRVLFTGALGDATHPSPVEVYDPGTGTFILTGSMRTPRVFYAVAPLLDGRVLIVGGEENGSSGDNPPADLASAELYNPRTGTFSPTGSMAHARLWPTATLLRDGRVLVSGGNEGLNRPVPPPEVYDPTTGTFSATASMETARTDHTATVLSDGRILIVGGHLSDNSLLASAELYDPIAGTFSSAGSMSTARVGHTATLLLDGRVLIVGGCHLGPITLASTELYQP